MKTNIGVNKMSKKKTVRYSSHWYEVASNENDIRNNERYKKSCELINTDHTFGNLIRLKEYNNSLNNLIGYLCELRRDNSFKHDFVQTLSKKDKDFYFGDLINLHMSLNRMVRDVLQDEKNLDDWTVFADGYIGRKSEQDNLVKPVNI